MSLSATLFGRDSFLFKATNIMGLGIPGWLDKTFGAPTQHGPRLSDLTVQSSTMGAPLARVYGMVALTGNVIWLEENKLKETVRKKKSGGKGGGGGSSVKTYTYSATFAVSLCEGPIAGVRRIWVGADLIYNAGSDDLETVIASNQAQSSAFRIYYGEDDQPVDPRIEADMGVGQTPAFRGTAYIVFYDLPLAKYGNSLMGAQVKVEVMKGSTFAPVLIREEVVPIVYSVTGTGIVNPFDHEYKTYVITESPGSGAGEAGKLIEVSLTGRRRELPVRRPLSVPSARSVYDVEGISDRSMYWCTHNTTASGTAYLWNEVGVVSLGTRRARRIVDISDTGTYVITNNQIDSDDWWVEIINTDPVQFSRGAHIVGYGCVAAGGGLVVRAYKTVGSPELIRIEIYDSNLVYLSDFSSSYPSELPIGYTNQAVVVNGSLFMVTGVDDDILKIWQWDLTEKSFVRAYALPIPGLASNTSSADATLGHQDGIFVYAAQYAAPDVVKAFYFRLDSLNEQGVLLSDVVRSEMELSALIEAGDINVADLSDDAVRGYRLPGVQPIRGALEPLQTAWPFDMISSGYQVKAVRRGKSSSQTVTIDQLDARQYGDQPGVRIDIAREMDTQLPRKASVKHLDGDRDYDVSEQYSPERLSSQAVNIVEYDLPIVLSPDEAAQMSEVLFNVPWVERDTLSFRLPPSFAAVEPSDVITIDAEYAQFPVRLTEVSYRSDGIIDVVGRPSAVASYASAAVGGEGVTPGGEVPLAGQAEYVLLDIPLIRNDENTPGFAAAMAGTTNSWPGGVLYRSTDNGQTWTDMQAWEAPVTMGEARNAIGAHDGRVVDRASQLRVDVTGELESVTESQMMIGINWAAYGADQRWEIIRFADAALQSDGSYILSTLLRGLRGTEWTTGLHQAGDTFVLLDDPDVAFIGADLSALGVDRQWSGVSVGQSVEDVDSTSFAYRGVNLKPFSPVHGEAVLSGADWVLTWDARTRLRGSVWKTGVPLPIGEAVEAYQVDIMDGAAVVRTLSATTETVTYTEAQQIEDFGSAQSSIAARVYQISADVGRGLPHEITA